MEISSLLPVILSGGSGTRLWPLSRETYPKQLLALTGPHTMLQQTALRLEGLAGNAKVLDPCVVCNAEYRFITAEQLQAAGKPASSILLEPFGRNTAPALTLAALHAHAGGQDPLLLVMPADHVIARQDAFQAAVRQGIPAARGGAMVTFGIVPERAETGYGYLRRGAAAPDGSYALDRFVEKPDAEHARRYLDSGDYLWNSGLFMMHASVWLAAIAHFDPAMLAACTAALQAARADVDFIRIDTAAFEACPSDSIDYAVMEKLAAAPQLGIAARVVPMEAGWSDVGAWDALWDILDKDEAGNAACGETLLERSANSLLFASSRLVAGVGLDNIVVVETPDAVLVAAKDCAQDVKKIVARLKAEGRTLADTHRKVNRPWGWYDSIDGGDRFQVKRIVVKPGASLSLQMHHHRAEHWIVVRGTAEVTHGDKVMLLSENESTYIPLGHVHRLANPGKVPLEIIEVQSGSYLGEDDIVRFEDTYGRAPAAQPGA
ncbi:mannose-1-phosphate guanylyltransferase/mannose-6-phosphate isomerase [Thauera aromatica]|uniref:mannose-1-phosphate guanylyltransferase n=1 Tax=Thauera aromatica K172 TaxID=44139 RepID=A0A2R4BKM3_THAAR|nr:mannose-1-phosphate guanylyltransferase/mannose-6-phosphate isomerase [Thauera aromatica]AVR87876.1 Mannose-1-phosphate guanylyltransferase [Thauera aromatica K172]